MSQVEVTKAIQYLSLEYVKTLVVRLVFALEIKDKGNLA